MSSREIHKAGREGGWVLVGQVLSIGGALFGLKMLTMLLGKAGYGELALGMTVPGVASMFIFAPPRNAASRYLWACREDGSFGSYLFVLRWWYLGALAVAVCVGVLGAMLVWALRGPRWGVLMLIASILAAISGLSNALFSFHNDLRNRPVAAMYQAAGSWGRALLATAAVVLFSHSATYAMLGYLSAECLAALLLWRRTWSEGWFVDAWRQQPPSAEWRRLASPMVRYSLPFFVWSLLAATGIYADRWVVAGVLGSATVGVYVALYQIASRPVELLVGVAGQWLNPIIFQRAGALRHRDQAARSMRLVRISVAATITVGAVTALAAFLYGHQITALLATRSFASGGELLWVFVAGTTLFLIGQNLVTVGMIHWSNWRYVPAFAVQGVSIILLTYELGSRWGLAGAAAGFCAGNAIYAGYVGLVNLSIPRVRTRGALEQA